MPLFKKKEKVPEKVVHKPDDFGYEANVKLVEAGFASIMHLAVLEGLKRQTWEVEGAKGTMKLYGEDVEFTKKQPYEPKISFAFEGGWDLGYPATVEMRTYGGHGGTLDIHVKYGESSEMTPTEERFCLEVIRLWKLCEKALLTESEPRIGSEEIQAVVNELHKRSKLALKNLLDKWKEEDYVTGAKIIIVLARAVEVDPVKLAKTVWTSFGNPFHKFPYVERTTRVDASEKTPDSK